MITGFIKLLIGLIGIIATLILLGTAVFDKDKKYNYKRAGIAFVTTVTLIVLITIVEFIIINPMNFWKYDTISF